MTNNNLPRATVKEEAVVLPETNGAGGALAGVQIEHRGRPHGAVLDRAEELQTLFASQRWVPASRRSRIAYPAPQELVAPFLECLRPLSDLGIGLSVQTSHPNSVQDPDTEALHTAYGRFLVEARIGGLDATHHQSVIGFVVALDVKTPEVQVYYGRNARACINLAIFRKDHYLKASMLDGGEEKIYATARRFVEHFGEDERQFIESVQRLQSVVWSEKEINERIGRLYRRFLTRGNLTSTLNYAIRLLMDANSRYALKEDGTTTAWNFVSAMTQYVTDKAYLNSKAEKTLEIMEHVAGDLLGLGAERAN